MLPFYGSNSRNSTSLLESPGTIPYSTQECVPQKENDGTMYGKSLLRRRGESVKRSFAHCYETGGMRRTHLRGHENILKRQLIHEGAFNLSLILRALLGAGTPREWKNQQGELLLRLFFLAAML